MDAAVPSAFPVKTMGAIPLLFQRRIALYVQRRGLGLFLSLFSGFSLGIMLLILL